MHIHDIFGINYIESKEFLNPVAFPTPVLSRSDALYTKVFGRQRGTLENVARKICRQSLHGGTDKCIYIKKKKNKYTD